MPIARNQLHENHKSSVPPKMRSYFSILSVHSRMAAVQFREIQRSRNRAFFLDRGCLTLADIHQYKAGSIPYLIGKIPCRFHFSPVKRISFPGCFLPRGKTGRICSVFSNHLKRIDSVAEDFRHFAALTVAYNAMDNPPYGRGASP